MDAWIANGCLPQAPNIEAKMYQPVWLIRRGKVASSHVASLISVASPSAPLWAPLNQAGVATPLLHAGCNCTPSPAQAAGWSPVLTSCSCASPPACTAGCSSGLSLPDSPNIPGTAHLDHPDLPQSLPCPSGAPHSPCQDVPRSRPSSSSELVPKGVLTLRL